MRTLHPGNSYLAMAAEKKKATTAKKATKGKKTTAKGKAKGSGSRVRLGTGTPSSGGGDYQ